MNDVLTTTLKAVRMNRLADKKGLRYKDIPYRSCCSAFAVNRRRLGLKISCFMMCGTPFASRLVMAGVDFPTVKQLTDPKDITMTLRRTHLSSDYKQHAVRTLARVGECPGHFYN
jgi:hypothetical protein